MHEFLPCLHGLFYSLFLLSMYVVNLFLFGKKKAIDIEPIYNYISEYDLAKGFHQ